MPSDNYNEFNDAAEPFIPDALRQQVEDELAEGETVQWIEQPVLIYFTASSTSGFLFAIPWTAFALFWTAMVTLGVMNANGNGNGGIDTLSLFFPLFGLPFIIIGLCMLSTPLQNRRKMKRTVYAVTDRRAIIIEGGWFAFNVESYCPEDLLPLRKKKKSSGSGDVYFAVNISHSKQGSHEDPAGFINIRHVDEAYEWLRELKAKSKQEQE